MPRRSAHTGTAPVIGDGSNRFTHRVHDSVTNTWTAWVDDFVQIDSVQPFQHDRAADDHLATRPGGTVPLTAGPTPPRPCTWNGGQRRRLDDRDRPRR